MTATCTVAAGAGDPTSLARRGTLRGRMPDETARWGIRIRTALVR